jgi:hypothetical protein
VAADFAERIAEQSRLISTPPSEPRREAGDLSSLRRVLIGSDSTLLSNRRQRFLRVAMSTISASSPIVASRPPGSCRRDLEGVGGEVGQDDAVAIEDQAAVGRDRHDRDAVVLYPGRVSSCLETRR